jgi:hypothetical protein
VEDSSEHGNEPSGSVKFWEILEFMSDCRLLRNGSAPWSQLIKEIITLHCENRAQHINTCTLCAVVILSEVVL